jgi:hypothetical protein
MPARTSNAFLTFSRQRRCLGARGRHSDLADRGGAKPQDLDLKRAAARIAVREKLDKETAALLTTEGWVDKAKGVVRVPVTDVYTATIAELAAKKPAPSQIKVEPPLPMPVIDPKATEPPPPALPSAPQGADTIRFAAPEPKPAASIEPAAAGVAANPLTK